MAKQKSRVSDTTPLHLGKITPEDAEALSSVSATVLTIIAPTVYERFCRILPTIDVLITLGTDVDDPPDPDVGDFKILSNTPEWIQLPVDSDGVEKAEIKIMSVSGSGSASITWHQ